jgi:hypothetical protein
MSERALPGFVARAIARAWPKPSRAKTERLTGLTDAEWRRLAAIFPRLGDDPGRHASRARRTFMFLAWNELLRSRPRLEWKPAPPPSAPQVLLTAHVGNLRLLRYFLRSAGVPVATIVDDTHFGNDGHEEANRRIDRRFPTAFPHRFSSREPHRLRSALRRGSLLAAIDRIHHPLPGTTDHSARIPFLGGTIEIELAPLRLARLAGVRARPVFITAPAARLTITVGDALPADEGEAARAFGVILDRVARASPADFDGYTHRFAAGSPAGASR